MVDHDDVVSRARPANLGLTFPLRFLAALGVAAGMTGDLAAQKDCNRTTTGVVPLTEMGAARYQGFAGELYPGGNRPPAAHAADGAAAAAAIQRLDGNGQPSATGRIVVVSIGMSNTTQEFSEFVRISDADPLRKPGVTVVDLAQGGMDARKVAQPNHVFWTNAMNRLTQHSLTAQQVQVAWLKEAVAGPTQGFPAHADELRDLLAQIVRNLEAKFPNIRICYLSSRIYAGYAGTTLNPEPYGFESGFAVRGLIERQIAGEPTLNHDPNRGAVVAPWLAWGPYLWADGLTPRGDGLVWECADFAADGTHPSTSGRRKVAVMLNDHFTTDSTAKAWYGGTPGGGGGGAAAMSTYGAACRGSTGVLSVRWNSLPTLGNPDLRIGFTQGLPNRLALFFLSVSRVDVPVQGCSVYVDPAQVFLAAQRTTNAGGTAFVQLAVPNDVNLIGAKCFGQWFATDPGSPNLRLIGGGAATAGIEVLLGR